MIEVHRLGNKLDITLYHFIFDLSSFCWHLYLRRMMNKGRNITQGDHYRQFSNCLQLIPMVIHLEKSTLSSLINICVILHRVTIIGISPTVSNWYQWSYIWRGRPLSWIASIIYAWYYTGWPSSAFLQLSPTDTNGHTFGEVDPYPG